jgi:hypothetical protein
VVGSAALITARSANVWDGKIEGESDSRKVAEAATDAVADYIFDVVNLPSPVLIKPCLVRVPGRTPLGG